MCTQSDRNCAHLILWLQMEREAQNRDLDKVMLSGGFLTGPQDHFLSGTSIIRSAFQPAHFFAISECGSSCSAWHNFCEMLSVSPADTAEPFLDHFCVRMLSAYMFSVVWTKSLRDFLVLCLTEVMNTCVVSSFMQGNSCLQKNKSSHTEGL